ncbi:MAG: M81 family metallopeptidase [Pirellulales bacterium]
MVRVALAECKQEVSSFNPSRSHYGDFRVARGAELIAHHRRCREEMGGALDVLGADSRIELVPAFGASANTSGGILAAADFARLADEFLGDLESAARGGALDAVYFSLHGAMQAEGEDDPEGFLLQESRRRLGAELPFVVSLDLHGILTDRMLEASDAVVAYHTYPHVDFFETGARAARVLQRILFAGARPVTARVKIPALVRGDELITETGLIRHCIQRARAIESLPRGLSAAVLWGNPFTDVPELGTVSLAVFDNDSAQASQEALELAHRFWEHHERMQVPLTPLSEAIRQAREVTVGTVVLMDAADATSSGASGDSTAIVREVLRQGYPGRVLAPVVDPPAVRRAFAAGVNGRLRVTVGGAIDPQRFPPLELDVRVRSLSDGKFRSESFGWPWDSGDTAVLEADRITLVVGSRPVSLFDRSWFFANGQDPRHFDLVVVKSPHCEHQMFASWCARLIHVDAPGATSANVRRLGHVRCARPLFPLDECVPFTPEVKLFQRPRWRSV